MKKGTFGLSTESYDGGKQKRVNGRFASGFEGFDEAAPRDDSAVEAYRNSRENGEDCDNPSWNFPNDGTYTWDTPNKKLSKICYNAGSEDERWMKEKHENYLRRVAEEEKSYKESPIDDTANFDISSETEIYIKDEPCDVSEQEIEEPNHDFKEHEMQIENSRVKQEPQKYEESGAEHRQGEVYKSSVEDDADDSSDEEDECDYGGKPVSESTRIPAKVVLVHRMSLELYRSKAVNELYYPMKRAYLGDNQAHLTKEYIGEIIEKVIDGNIDSFFPLTNLGNHKEFKKKFNKEDKQKIYNKIKKVIDQIVDFFYKYQRLFFKTMTLQQNSNISPNKKLDSLEESIKNIKFIIINYINNNINRVYFEYIKSITINVESLICEIDNNDFTKRIECVKTVLLNYKILICKNKQIKFNEKRRRGNGIEKCKEKINNIAKEQRELLLFVLDEIGKVSNSNRKVEDFLDAEAIKIEYIKLRFMEDVESNILEPAKEGKNPKTFKLREDISIKELKNNTNSFFVSLYKNFTSQINTKCEELNLNFSFATFIKKISEKHNFYFVRVTLPTASGFLSKGVLSPLSFVRLFNRSQTRLIRNRSYEREQLKFDVPEQTESRYISFKNEEKPDFYVLENQNITINGYRKDVILNLGSYSKIYKSLHKFIKTLNITDSDFVFWIRQTLKNEKIKKLEDLREINPSLCKYIYEFLSKFTYILFVVEPARNPSCWILHHMMLDLIKNQGQKNWNWNNTIGKKKKEKGKEQEDNLMPMSIVSEDNYGAVKAARRKNKLLKDKLGYYYNYQGEEPDENSANRLITKEENLIKAWMEMKLGKRKKYTIKEIEDKIYEAIVEWYEVRAYKGKEGKVIGTVANELPPIKREPQKDLPLANGPMIFSSGLRKPNHPQFAGKPATSTTTCRRMTP